MGGVETSRDGGATQEITKVVLFEITLNCCGGGRMPRWGKIRNFKTIFTFYMCTCTIQSYLYSMTRI